MQKISPLHTAALVCPLPDTHNTTPSPHLPSSIAAGNGRAAGRHAAPDRSGTSARDTDTPSLLTPAQIKAGNLIRKRYHQRTERKLLEASEGLTALLAAHGTRLAASGKEVPSLDTMQGGEILVAARAGMGRPGYDAYPYQPGGKKRWSLHSALFLLKAPLRQSAGKGLKTEQVFRGGIVELNGRRLGADCAVDHAIYLVAVPSQSGDNSVKLRHTTGFASTYMANYLESLAKEGALYVLNDELTHFIALSALLGVAGKLEASRAVYLGPRFNCNHVTKAILEEAIRIANAEHRMKRDLASVLQAEFGLEEGAVRHCLKDFALIDVPLLAAMLREVHDDPADKANTAERSRLVIAHHIADRAGILANELARISPLPIDRETLQKRLLKQVSMHPEVVAHFDRTDGVLKAAGKPGPARDRCGCHYCLA